MSKEKKSDEFYQKFEFIIEEIYKVNFKKPSVPKCMKQARKFFLTNGGWKTGYIERHERIPNTCHA